MKIAKIGVSLLLIVVFGIECATPPDLQRVQLSSNISSQILNLRNSGDGNVNAVRADSVMKNGFLNTGEEYGYYTLSIGTDNVRYNDSRFEEYNELYIWFVLIFTVTLGFWLGAPFDISEYDLTVNMDILDCNKNIIRSYSDSTRISKAAGMYYGGDATRKASRAFTRMIRNIQQQAAIESSLINEELQAAGPIRRQTAPKRQNDLTGATNNAARTVMDALRQRNLTNAKIAIVNIFSKEREQAEFIAAELEFNLVSGNFIVVDRSELDRIRREQNFQLSGDVDDDQIVSVGRFAGAGLVITGSVTGSGDMRRLRLRALDTQSAEVRAAASEQF